MWAAPATALHTSTTATSRLSGWAPEFHRAGTKSSPVQKISPRLSPRCSTFPFPSSRMHGCSPNCSNEGMIWEPSKQFIERTNVWRFMQELGFEDPEAFLRFSRDEPERFWDAVVRDLRIEWFEPYRQVIDLSRGP